MMDPAKCVERNVVLKNRVLHSVVNVHLLMARRCSIDEGKEVSDDRAIYSISLALDYKPRCAMVHDSC